MKRIKEQISDEELMELVADYQNLCISSKEIKEKYNLNQNKSIRRYLPLQESERECPYCNNEMKAYYPKRSNLIEWKLDRFLCINCGHEESEEVDFLCQCESCIEQRKNVEEAITDFEKLKFIEKFKLILLMDSYGDERWEYCLIGKVHEDFHAAYISEFVEKGYFLRQGTLANLEKDVIFVKYYLRIHISEESKTEIQNGAYFMNHYDWDMLYDIYQVLLYGQIASAFEKIMVQRKFEFYEDIECKMNFYNMQTDISFFEIMYLCKNTANYLLEQVVIENYTKEHAEHLAMRYVHDSYIYHRQKGWNFHNLHLSIDSKLYTYIKYVFHQDIELLERSASYGELYEICKGTDEYIDRWKHIET